MPASIGIGVARIVQQPWSGNLLMVQRAGAHGAGKWSMPGGWIDLKPDGSAETPTEAAIREVLEETGITAAPVPNHYYRRFPLTWPTVDGVPSYCAFVELMYSGGEPTVTEPDKCPIVRWVPIDEVRGMLDRGELFQHLADYMTYFGRRLGT